MGKNFRNFKLFVFIPLLIIIVFLAVRFTNLTYGQTLSYTVALPIAQTAPVFKDIEISVDEIVASGFEFPVELAAAWDGTNRLFVAEQPGTIRIIKSGVVLSEPFLDLRSLVVFNGEQGLLGLTFHPEYSTNGYLFVNYTRTPDGATVIARYQVSQGNPDLADENSAKVILVIPQPNTNHNGGKITFGPDGYLYIATGDGGGAGDPQNNAQNLNSLLGKILRIDINQGDPYLIPSDNPFDFPGARGEIWSFGLRNPWRFSFDRLTGDLYIGDVGQGAKEEIDYLAFGTPGGVNFGWDCMEGTIIYSTDPPCENQAYLNTLTPPLLDYDRAEGRSVTGGYVYRGQSFPDMVGRYFYADFVSGAIWSIQKFANGTWSEIHSELDTTLNISSIGEDEAGELYVLGYSNGVVYRINQKTN
jgi:glucose/arabinose dehydrogenase